MKESWGDCLGVEGLWDCQANISHGSDIQEGVAALAYLIEVVLPLAVLEHLDALVNRGIKPGCLRARYFDLLDYLFLLNSQILDAAKHIDGFFYHEGTFLYEEILGGLLSWLADWGRRGRSRAWGGGDSCRGSRCPRRGNGWGPRWSYGGSSRWSSGCGISDGLSPNDLAL